MNSVRKLSKKDLNQLINEASKELEARKREETILKELTKVFDKHGVTRIERRSLLNKVKPGGKPGSMKVRKRPVQVKKKSIKKVAPKFKNPDGNETWTGRGLAPKWVSVLCAQHKISIERFKTDPRFAL